MFGGLRRVYGAGGTGDGFEIWAWLGEEQEDEEGIWRLGPKGRGKGTLVGHGLWDLVWCL